MLHCLATLPAAPRSPSLLNAEIDTPIQRSPFPRGASQSTIRPGGPPAAQCGGCDPRCVAGGGRGMAAGGAGQATRPTNNFLLPPIAFGGDKQTAVAANLAARDRPSCPAPRLSISGSAHRDALWPAALRPVASLLALPPSRAGVALVHAAMRQILQTDGGARNPHLRTSPTCANCIETSPAQPSLPPCSRGVRWPPLRVELWRLLSCHPAWYRRALIEAAAAAGRTELQSSAAGGEGPVVNPPAEASAMVGLVAWVLAPGDATGEDEATVCGEKEAVPGAPVTAPVPAVAAFPIEPADPAAHDPDLEVQLRLDQRGLSQPRSRRGATSAPCVEEGGPHRHHLWRAVQQAARAARLAVTDEQASAAVDSLLLSASRRASFARPGGGAANGAQEAWGLGGGGTGAGLPAGRDWELAFGRGLALQSAIAAGIVAAEPRPWLGAVWAWLLRHAEGEAGVATGAVAECRNSCGGGAQAESLAQVAGAPGKGQALPPARDGGRRTAHVSSLFTSWLSSLLDACCEDTHGAPRLHPGPIPPTPRTTSRPTTQQSARSLLLASAVAHTAADVAQSASGSSHADDAQRVTATLLVRVEAAMDGGLTAAAPDSGLGGSQSGAAAGLDPAARNHRAAAEEGVLAGAGGFGSDALEGEVEAARRLLTDALQRAWGVLSRLS